MTWRIFSAYTLGYFPTQDVIVANKGLVGITGSPNAGGEPASWGNIPTYIYICIYLNKHCPNVLGWSWMVWMVWDFLVDWLIPNWNAPVKRKRTHDPVVSLGWPENLSPYFFWLLIATISLTGSMEIPGEQSTYPTALFLKLQQDTVVWKGRMTMESGRHFLIMRPPPLRVQETKSKGVGVILETMDSKKGLRW